MKTKQSFNIIIPADMKPRPKTHEEASAVILANHFMRDVYFIATNNHRSPDVKIGNTEWEIKSPIGASENNIQKNMREAASQSSNIVVDLRRSRLHQTRALGYIKQFAERSKKVKRVIIITKSKDVLTIK